MSLGSFTRLIRRPLVERLSQIHVVHLRAANLESDGKHVQCGPSPCRGRRQEARKALQPCTVRPFKNTDKPSETETLALACTQWSLSLASSVGREVCIAAKDFGSGWMPGGSNCCEFRGTGSSVQAEARIGPRCVECRWHFASSDLHFFDL